jgi:hypothetical protein
MADTQNANTSKTKELPQRVLDIASAIRGFCLGISEDHDEMLGYKDQASKADVRVSETRMDTCAKIAQMSHDQKWDANDIDAACAYAKNIAMGNRPADDKTAKTVGVFCSQMKSVAHPRVRASFPVILTSCTQAWNAEGLMTEGDKPIRKFKGRLYNLIISATVAVRSGETVIKSPDDVVSWARDNDPDFDENKIEARLHNVGKILKGISDDFGDAKIALVCEYLSNITAKQLKTSRNVMVAKNRKAEAERMAGHKLANVTPILPAAHDDEDEDEENTNEPAPGAFDLNATLNDLDTKPELLAAD